MMKSFLIGVDPELLSVATHATTGDNTTWVRVGSGCHIEADDEPPTWHDDLEVS
jgi:hypothetical protein